MRRCPFSRWIWLGPSVSLTSAMRRSGTRPAGALDQQIAEARRRAVGIGKAHDDVEAAVAFDDLRDDPAVRHAPRALR